MVENDSSPASLSKRLGRWRSWLALLGVVRSLIVYWRPGRQQALRSLYRPFLPHNGLVFDVGAHVGDRSRAFAALGARVVAFEPQPHVFRVLQFLLRRNLRITLRPEALGKTVGTAPLAISLIFPTVSSLSRDWRSTLQKNNPGFSKVRWPVTVTVELSTLDAMIAEYGVPDFCKIDVEGYESDVLSGLHHPIAGLSFEFVAGALEQAVAAIQELERIGDYRFNVIEGEKRHFLFAEWHQADAIRAWLDAGADSLPSGDIYARKVSGQEE